MAKKTKKSVKKKLAKKKPARKTFKKAVKRSAQKVSVKMGKPIGAVTHFYSGIKVGIFKFNKPVKIGREIHVKGATTDFKTKIGGMQYNHKDIKLAPKGKQIGIKLSKRVRVGDKVFETK